MQNKMEKRGQATIFIILGIIVIIIAMAITYTQSEDFRERVQNIAFRSVAVPEQAQGVVNYVEGCINDIVIDGLEGMSWQGGHVEVPIEISANPLTYLRFNEEIIVPYWLYGQDTIDYPTIGEMEIDLKNFIETEFPNRCDFTEYLGLGYEISNTDISVDVNIDTNNINVDLESDFNVEIKGESFNLNDYVFVNVPTRFRELYQTGLDILERELNGAPLEFDTINLLSIYGHHNSEAIPFGGVEFSCGSKKWLIPNVREVLRNVIAQNIIDLKVEGTQFDPIDNLFYESRIIDSNNILQSRYENTAVRINYLPEWPFNLDISPKQGLSVSGDNIQLAGIPFVPIFCLKNYDFKYDIKYPVLIEVTDTNTGFSFRYAIEVVIKDNYGRNRLFNVDLDVDENTLINDNFCNVVDDNMDIINVDVQDAMTREPLENVEVIFNCVEHYCNVGKTEIDDFGSASFSSGFPNCREGELILSKDGYSPFRRIISTYTPPLDTSTNQGFSVDLEPFRDKTAEIVILDVDGNNIVERPINEDEVVVIQLNRFNREFNDYDFKTAITFDGVSEKEVSLVPADGASATYEVISSLISNKNIRIPEYNSGSVSVPAFDIDGGIVIGGAQYEWDLARENLDNNGRIIFYVLSNGIPRTYTEMEEGLTLHERSQSYTNRLIPTYDE